MKKKEIKEQTEEQKKIAEEKRLRLQAIMTSAIKKSGGSTLLPVSKIQEEK